MTKLNKEQLKKLYDYGGTLNPRDWANMIDSVVPPSDGKYTIVKTTYESVRDLYYKGQMEYGVKYEFDHIHHNYSADSALYMPNLQVYIDNKGNLKANYIAPNEENISYINIESAHYPGESVQISSYDRSFTSDFRFDYFITSALHDKLDGSYVYEINNKKTITLEYQWESVNEESFNNFINNLNSLGIPCTYNASANSEVGASLFITFNDCNRIYIDSFSGDYGYDIILYDKYAIIINTDYSEADLTIQEIDLLHLPLIENIEYDTGCFHNILVDAHLIDMDGVYSTVYLYGDIYKIPTDSYMITVTDDVQWGLDDIGGQYVIYDTDINSFLELMAYLYQSEDNIVEHSILCINNHYTKLVSIYDF